jgi:hypothetical protein
MKLVAKFQALSTGLKVLVLAIAFPSLVLIVGPLTTAFGLPLIGYGVSRNSWRAGKRSSDKKVYLLFALSLVATVTALLVLRQPQFRTDWEGGNPLDDLIMLLWLANLVSLSATWYLAGWVGHRLFMGSKDRKIAG